MGNFTVVIEPTEEGITIGQAEEISATIIGPKELVLDVVEAGVDAVDANVESVTKYF